MKVRLAQALLIILACGIYEVLWQAGALSETTFAGLGEILRIAGRDIATEAYWTSGLLPTIAEVLWAFVFGTVLGIAVGVASWRLPSFYTAIQPYLAVTYAIPVFIFYPAAIGLLGFGKLPVIIIAGAFASPVVAMHTVNGLRSTSTTHLGVARSFNLTKKQMLWRIYAPSAWPETFAGIRLGMSFVVVAVLATEFILSTQGIGHAISLAYENFTIPEMWASILLALALSLLLTGGLGLLAPTRREKVGG